MPTNRKHLRTTKFLAVNGLIAAAYVVLTFTVPLLSFSAVQFRLSELLAVLPVFYPPSIAGLGVGCLVSNLVGFFTGLNPIGLIDSVVGTAATLLAAGCTYVIGRYLPRKGVLALAPLPPVIFNGLMVGAELTFLFTDGFSGSIFFVNAGWVALGEIVVCYLLGVPLMLLLYRKNFYQRIFS